MKSGINIFKRKKSIAHTCVCIG